MLSDIVSAKTGTADVLFLVALILAVLGALLTATERPPGPWGAVLGWLAIAGLAAGLLVL